jgi:hypothetical protein
MRIRINADIDQVIGDGREDWEEGEEGLSL